MNSKEVSNKIYDASISRKKLLAILVDPDQAESQHLQKIVELSAGKADCFLVGGSLLTHGNIDETAAFLKKASDIPVVIFPGSPSQISENADAILFLSLLSGRNPETLIGQQVMAAPFLKKSKLEIISTAYLLIDSGSQTTASYISNSTPIPSNKPGIAVSTAIAGELLGFNLIYMDAGSGAKNPISAEMIQEVKSNIDIPLIIGGGLNSRGKVKSALDAGADMIVVGSAFEENPNFILEAAEIIESFNK